MNGLEISIRYYWDHGYPLIEQKFGLYKERIATGLIGEGSECFGFDDEISRDHDWGPRFCLWLNKQDYQEIGLRLKKELASLPAEYEGIEPGETTEWGKNRAGVFEIGGFYKRFIGFDHIPTELKDWRVLNEIQLAACTNGKVFTDPLGEFTRFRLALKKFYPIEAPTQYGPRIKGLAVYLNQYQILPFDRCRQFFEDLFGQPLNAATIYASLQQAAHRLYPFQQQVAEALIQAEVVHFDETSLFENKETRTPQTEQSQKFTRSLDPL